MKQPKHLFIFTGEPMTGKTSLCNLINTPTRSIKHVVHIGIGGIRGLIALNFKDKNGKELKIDTFVLDTFDMKNGYRLFTMTFMDLMLSGYNFSNFILVVNDFSPSMIDDITRFYSSEELIISMVDFKS